MFGDPVVSGLVRSLARPGGSVTGLSFLAPEVAGKQLDFLKEAFPKILRVGILWNPANAGLSSVLLKEAEAAARRLGLSLQRAPAKNLGDLDGAFSTMTKAHVDALVVLLDAALASYRIRIVELAAKSHLPAMYPLLEFAEAGGLMAYATPTADGYRRAATYIDRILKGARPGDLPVEQPTKFELVINLKTAKALGLTIPPSLLARADEIIE